MVGYWWKSSELDIKESFAPSPGLLQAYIIEAVALLANVPKASVQARMGVPANRHG